MRKGREGPRALPVIPPFEGSFIRGYGSFRAKNKRRCSRCGHERFHHLGFKEPGCSHLGQCACSRFRSS